MTFVRHTRIIYSRTEHLVQNKNNLPTIVRKRKTDRSCPFKSGFLLNTVMIHLNTHEQLWSLLVCMDHFLRKDLENIELFAI